MFTLVRQFKAPAVMVSKERGVERCGEQQTEQQRSPTDQSDDFFRFHKPILN